MKRTKVCSFDFFLENTGTTTGQSPFDDATRTSLVSIHSSSKNTTYFLAKYHGNKSKRVNKKCHVKSRLDELELLFL